MEKHCVDCRTNRNAMSRTLRKFIGSSRSSGRSTDHLLSSSSSLRAGQIDYEEWPKALQEQVTINDCVTTGTIGKLAGWKVFEQHIAKGSYVDFEVTTLDGAEES
jgi:hypothetical protein